MVNPLGGRAAFVPGYVSISSEMRASMNLGTVELVIICKETAYS